MNKIPTEHFIDYLQVISMLGSENITNSKQNIVQNLIFSNIHFNDFRQVLLIITAINAGVRALDVIFIISYILTANRFEPNRTNEPNDFRYIYT